MEPNNEGVIFYLISDSVGETIQRNLSAVISQFPSLHVKEVKRYAFVESVKQLEDILQQLLKDQGMLLLSLVNPELVKHATCFCQEKDLPYVDYMTPLTRLITEKTGVLPIETPGAMHQLNKAYFKRIEAIEFAVKYDDGKDVRGFKEADFVLIGISRTSKTPLSMYLANMNYKVANLPLVPEVPLPDELFDVPAHKIIGLTNSVDCLLRVRKTRLKAFGLKEESSYTNVTRIQEELIYASHVFKQLGIVPIDVHDKSIEETAMIIEMNQ